jgi:hypothetical protein
MSLNKAPWASFWKNLVADLDDSERKNPYEGQNRFLLNDN